MLSFHTALQDILAQCTSKTNWATQLKAALGASRRLKCLKNGVEFLNVGLVGPMTIADGAITGFGTVQDITVQNAVDVSTGTCVLRIEGGGYWLQGSFGLEGSGADFTIPSNPTETSGWAFKSSVRVRGRASLPTTAAPSLLDLIVYFGPQGASEKINIAEVMYEDMPVGFSTDTQKRWRSDPIVVNGVTFTLYPGITADGYSDCWVYAHHATVPTKNDDLSVNRVRANVELRVDYQGVEQNLFTEGSTYQFTQQRGTWFRWQSEAMVWNTTHVYIDGLIDLGTFLRHDSRNVFGTLESTNANPYANVVYRPFKQFGSLVYGNYISDQLRGSPTGGERHTIGPVHESFARLVSEVGTNNNEAWVTADKVNTLQLTAEAIAAWPGSALIDTDYRILDPSSGASGYCIHRNPNAWAPCVGIPQPMQIRTTPEAPFDAEFDTAHHFNKVSFYSYHLSKDPYHLLMVQGAAVASLAYGSGFDNKRGTDGKTLHVVTEEERGFWWALQTVFHAWHATPEGTMPKPFRDKAFFAQAIENTLTWFRNAYINGSNPRYTGAQGEAIEFWRFIVPFTGFPAGEIQYSPFMSDYGAIVMGQALLLGYSNAKDVAEWVIEGQHRRALCGGNWFQEDVIADGVSRSVMATTDVTLPYTTIEEFKAWYPRPGAYMDGYNIPAGSMTPRDAYMFIGLLRLYQGIKDRGLITLSWEPGDVAADVASRFPPPYNDPNSGLPYNHPIWSKQYFTY